MSTYKNISGDWSITVNNGTGTIYVDGNLDVAGNITYVTELAVDDAFIAVAANNTPVANVVSSGLIATKPTDPQTFAGLRFNSQVNAWQVSPSVTASGEEITPYTTLASGGTGVPGGNVNDIQINDGSGSFTADDSFQYDIANTKLTLAGYEVLSNIGTAPTAVANSVAIYNNAPGAGATGLYAVGTTTAADELISLTKARLFAIIF